MKGSRAVGMSGKRGIAGVISAGSAWRHDVVAFAPR